MENLYVIVGLGNPGRRYIRTRHNAGFRLVEKLAARWNATWTDEKAFHARLAWAARNERKLLLCEPQTFMNLSGEAVRAVADFFQAPPERMLAVVDDADLPLGHVRMRPEGSSGGHHGLESMEQHLGTQQFARLRIGIGRESEGLREIRDYVLSEFSPEESDLVEKVLARGIQQVECWLDEGIGKAMSRFNGPVAV